MNEKGFTYIELMIVLSVLAVILLVALPSGANTFKAAELETFLEQLEQELYYYQMLAVTEGKGIRVAFTAGSNTYTVREGMTILVRREGPEGLAFRSGTLGVNELRFLPGGGIQKAGTLRINYYDNSYRLTFHLLSGRFYFVKE